MSLPLPLPERLELAHLKTQLQTWRDRLAPVLALLPVTRGRLISADLASGAQLLEHRLGRAPVGWILVSPRAAMTVHQHDEADVASLPLTSTASGSVVLWVW